MNSRSDWLASTNPEAHLNAGFDQIAKEFLYQQDAGFLQFVIVAEFILISLGHDQSLLGLAQHVAAGG